MGSVGVFSATTECHVEFGKLSDDLRGKFQFSEMNHGEVQTKLDFDKSFAVRFEDIDELPNGYVKYFVTGIKRKDFVRALSLIFEENVAPGKTYPKQTKTGFLGATFVKNLSINQLNNRARHKCEGKCNPPNCRQSGCKCNKDLRRCV